LYEFFLIVNNFPKSWIKLYQDHLEIINNLPLVTILFFIF